MIFDILLKNVRVTVSMSRFFDLDLCPEIFLGSQILLLFGNQIFENYLEVIFTIFQNDSNLCPKRWFSDITTKYI